MRHIPNIITSLNLASGFIAVVFIMNGEPVTASWIILAAMLFDFLDGFASRLLHAYSDMGRELDSLADVVSFGVAPGLMIYSLLSGEMVSSSLSGKIPAIAAAAIFPVCAGLRLAKFNTDTTQTVSFKGLPTPAAALAVVTVILSSAYSDSALIRSFTASPVSVIIFSVVLSLLMVSRIPLLSLKFHDLKIRGNEGRYLLVLLTVAIAGIFRFDGIPWIIPVYVAVSLLSLLF
ncbi:MAG: CDP-diacylglycerol--serine O-phosphatidyltransferase [Bacteroidales bacterium]|jgi:CDP-diacylglycerol--serine O-phosphatidyltransferase